MAMFNSISGIVSAKAGDTARLTTGGIEWEFSMPERDVASLPALGSEGKVYTYLHHKEDSMRLLGFASAERRETFLELLKVDGIGVKGAVKILGGISSEELERAIDSEDLTRLSAIPGLGKKTAAKMVLSLKGKIIHEEERTEQASQFKDMEAALCDMGYDKKAVVAALDKAAAELGDALQTQDGENLLFRKAILLLSGG